MDNGRDDICLWSDRQVLGGLELLRATCFEFRYPLHTHDTFVIAAFRNGAQKHQIARRRGIAYPGTVMIIPPGEVHTGESAERHGGWEYSALYPAAGALETLSRELFQESRGSLDFGAELLIEDPEMAARLLAACEIAGRSPDAIAREEAIYGALDMLIQRYGQRTSGSTLREAPDARIRRALDYIHDHYDQPLRLKEIASQVDLSEFHFMRTFKAQMNVTVYRYLMLVRLNAAKRLLSAGNPAAEAAVGVGFYDQSHFTGNFRRYFGITPLQYAAACR